MPDKQYLIEDPDDIQVNEQNEIDTILGNPPGWILRWGITLILFAVVIFGLLSWWLKYPDIVPARVMIVTENPAIPLVAKSSGKINELKIDDNQVVKAGDLLAVIDSKESMDDILQLEIFITELEKTTPINYANLIPSKDLKLGALQGNYASLCQKIKDYKYHITSQSVTTKVGSLKRQIEETNLLVQALTKQQKNLVEELSIAKQSHARNKDLLDQGLISEIDYENSQSGLLQKQRQQENLEIQLINNNINIERLNNQIIDLQYGKQDNSSNKILSLDQVIEQIKSQIETWKLTFLVEAPIDGKVSMSKVWSEQQFVNLNEPIFTIVPDNGAGHIIGKAQLPVANSGKVEVDQIANLKLDGYSYLEYGLIKAKVKSISLVPKENFYLMEISLPDSLITTYNKTIPFRQEMQGSIDIITEDRRVIERIFDKVLNLLKNQ